MRRGKLTREQVVEICGESIIENLERQNCEPTNRVQTDGDDNTEWAATVNTPDHPEYSKVTCYYYLTPEQMAELAEHDGDGSYIDWEIEGYEVY